MTDPRIEEIRTSLSQITPGPWEAKWDIAGVWHIEVAGKAFGHVPWISQNGGATKANAEFIAKAPERLAYLLDATTRQQEEIARLRAALQEIDDERSMAASGLTPWHAGEMAKIARAALAGPKEEPHE